MLRVCIATYNLEVAADTLRRGIAPRFFVGRSAINLLQRSVVDIRADFKL